MENSIKNPSHNNRNRNGTKRRLLKRNRT